MNELLTLRIEVSRKVRQMQDTKSNMLSKYPGKGSAALRKKAKIRKTAEASRRRNRR